MLNHLTALLKTRAVKKSKNITINLRISVVNYDNSHPLSCILQLQQFVSFLDLSTLLN